MRRRLRPIIYIAGPFSGDQLANINKAASVGEIIYEMGAIPFIPHIANGFWHLMHPKEQDEWLRIDNEYLKVCDALFRISVPSKGADEEELLARKSGVPVLDTYPDVADFIGGWRRRHGTG